MTIKLSRLQCLIHMDFEGETKWLPFSRWLLKFIFLYGIVLSFFCQFDFNVFLNFQIQNYCIILSSITEINCRGANAVHRMTSLDGNVFPNTLPMWRESTGHRWIPRTKGKWYRGVFASVWSLLPGSFCTRELLVCFTACVKWLSPSEWQADSGLVSCWLCGS